MSVQRISSFKSFTEVKNQQASIKMHEENKTKREQLLAKIGQTLEEEGVTSFDELDEEKRTALVAKIFNEDRAEDIEAAKVKMGEPKKHEDEEGKKVQSTNESLVTEATRSQIGKIDKAGKITSVYVHWDGNPNTRIPLLKHYKDSKTLNKLLDLGKYGISSLEKQIGDKPQDFDKPDRGITLFYGRDRDEKDRDMTMKSDVKSISKYLKDAGNESNSEYVYLFDERDGKWYMADVYDDKELKPVKESVEVSEGFSYEEKMIENFLKKLAKDMDYSVKDAANFVKQTINKYGLAESLEVNEANKPKVGDELTMVKNDKKGKVVKCSSDQCDVDFGNGDVYGIVYRRIKGDKIEEAIEVNEDIDIHDKTADLMNKLQVQIGNLLHATKGNKEWTKELEAIKSAFEKLEDRFSIAVKKLGMIPESVEVFEGMFGSKDFDKTLVTYAIDKKADEIYVVSVDKVIHSSFPDVSKLDDKRFRMMFGVMLEENWLKQYDKLPKVGDILPAPKKDKAFESVEVNESEEYVAYVELEKGKKLIDTFKDYKAAKSWADKNVDKLLDDEKIERVGTMPKSKWDKEEAKHAIKEGEDLNEADTVWSLWGKKEPMGLSKAETKKVAEVYAKAISKKDNCKCTVNQRTLEEDSFDLDVDGEEFAGGSYNIYDDGQVVNMAVKSGVAYGKYNDSVDTIVKNLKSIKESVESIDEARSINKIQNEWTKVTAEMKSTVDSWKKAEGDAKAPLLAKLKELTAKKNSLESELNDAIADKDKDLELVVSEGNAFVYAAAKAKQEGKKEFEFNGKTYKVSISDTNLTEEVEVEINEEDITSDEQFKEYAFKVLKQAFEADFDEAKAQEVVDGILKVAGSNYGEAVGMLTSSLG
jgi:hypothetical protein